MNKTGIKINSLNFNYGKKNILNDINLDINQGSIQGIIGPNGAGKSTLLNILVGRLKPTQGDIKILGNDLNINIVKNIGYMPQKNAIYANLNIYENVDFFARMHGLSDKKKRNEIVSQVIETVKLSEYKNQVVYKLSGGMKQRVSLAISLVHEPKILILDEPTVGLDPELRHDFWNNFINLSSKGITILLTTHTMDDAIHCNKLAYMKSGKIIVNKSPEKFLDKNKDIYSLEQAFLKLSK